jgi:hypothetical protein
MKKILSILISLTCLTISAKAQILSQNEANNFADKLFEFKILSEKGQNALKGLIKKKLIQYANYQGDSSERKYLLLHKSDILTFCGEAFTSEMYYRSGTFEMQIVLENTNKQTLSNKQREVKFKEFEAKRKKSEWFLIEEKIKDEDNLPNKSWTMSTFPMGNRFDLSVENKLVHQSRSVFGKTCKRTLNDLLDIGLINKAIHAETLNLIMKNEVNLESNLLLYTAGRVQFYEDFEENKINQKKFLDSLQKYQIISSQKKMELLNSYKEFELKSDFEIVRYCNNVKVFDLSKYSKMPQIGYKQVFEEIKAIIPQFDFNNFNAKIENVDDRESTSIEQRVAIEFELDGKKYRNSFFYDWIDKKTKKGKEQSPLLVTNIDIHKGINKVLADRNSPQRLYFVNKKPENENPYGKDEFALILMTEEQYKLWGTFNAQYFIFEENHSNRFNSETVSKIVEEYERIGMFSHLTQLEIQKGKKKVDELANAKSYLEILSCFPKTLIYSDGEMSFVDSPYQDLMREFSELSRGLFKPTKIKDNYAKDYQAKKKETIFSFEFNGLQYSKKLIIQDDWIDFEVVNLVEKALKDNNVDGNTYFVNSDITYLFLTKEQHDFLSKNQPELFRKKED